MDHNLTFYQTCIKQLLATYQELHTATSEIELIFDDERQHYLAVRVGWHKQTRIYFCLVHIDIHDGQIIIQVNNTEDLLDRELHALGIPTEKIRLGLLPPEAQMYAPPPLQQAA
jgi:hypothetical protein